MHTTRLCLLLLFFAVSARGQAPTWSQDVAATIYNRCATCHHSGGVAPFSLMSYGDALGQSAAIKAAVQSGAMPPWPPDPAYSRLAHERVLTAAEKSKIIAWIDGGAPEGDPRLAPPQPTFGNGGDLPGTPDLILKIPPYTSTAAGSDVYRCFVLPTGQSADQYITALEAIPGNRAIVHHVLIFADTTGISTALDAADPGPGYTSFGGIGTNKAILLGGWVPGSMPLKYPAGFGTKLHKNAKLVLQIHYPAGSAGMQDSTAVRFFLTSAGSVRDVFIQAALSHETNITPPLVIPPNTVKSFVEQIQVPFDVSLMGVAPHMHLLGQNIESFGVSPAGDTQRFISIPNWDFHWQGFYLFRQVQKVKAGTTAFARATYDNTSGNHHNPSSPPQLVQAGENTTDEMMIVFFVYAMYQPGDELIVLDPSTPASVPGAPYYGKAALLQPYPQPASGQMIVKYYLDAPVNASIDLMNMSGQVVLRIVPRALAEQGYHTLPVDVSSLSSGQYVLRMHAGDHVSCLAVSIRR